MIFKPNKVAQAVREGLRYQYDKINRERKLKTERENRNDVDDI